MKRLLVLALVAVAGSSYALVVNGGFESNASLPATGWTTVNADAFAGISTSAVNAHSGDNCLFLGAPTANPMDELSQTLATTAGTAYAVTFWGRQSGGNATNSNSVVTFDGQTVFSGIMDSTWTQHTSTIVASSNSSILDLASWNSPSFAFFDDFSVTPVPEPASMVVLGAGALALMLRRRNGKQAG